MNGFLHFLGAWVDPGMIPVSKFFAAAAAATGLVSGMHVCGALARARCLLLLLAA